MNLPNSSEDWMRLARTLDRLLANHAQYNWDEFVSALHAVESDFTSIQDSTRDSNPSAVLEVKRRVAEVGLHVAILKRLSTHDCTERFTRLQELGFAQLQRELECTLSYSQYLMRVGNPSRAARTLEDVLSRNLPIESPACDELLQTAQRLIAQCRSDSSE